jgi:outer membrane protein
MINKRFPCGLGLAIAALWALPMTVAAAQGDILVRGGIGYVDPTSDNLTNALGPGADLKVDTGVSFTVEAVYMLTERWGVELLAAWPFAHDIDVDGLGEVAKVEHLPPTLSLQYYFPTSGILRPYVGLGLNYTTFTEEKARGALPAGTRLALDDSWGIAGQLGLDVDMGDNWFANLGLRYIDIDSDLKVNGSKVGSIEIDPLVYQLQVGYRFSRAPAAPVAQPAPPPQPLPAPAPAPVATVVDSDGDGVPDDRDLCPDTPRGERVDVHGCSCDITRQVQFAFDSAELTAAGRAVLDELAAELQRLTFIRGTIVGHTDGIGSVAYNQALSERRARAVVQYLESKGIERGRLQSSGAGKSQPVADNSTDEGRALNRRVVLSRTDC